MPRPDTLVVGNLRTEVVQLSAVFRLSVTDDKTGDEDEPDTDSVMCALQDLQSLRNTTTAPP